MQWIHFLGINRDELHLAINARIARRLVILCLLLPSFQSPAATPVETGNQELIRQQQRELLLRRQHEQTPDVRLQGPASSVDAGTLPEKEAPCFIINRILLTDMDNRSSNQPAPAKSENSAADFQWALDSADRTEDGSIDIAIGRCLGAHGINRVMERMQNAIIQRGFITTRIVAAPQDLNSGTLELTLIPGRIHSIRFTEKTASRATQWNALPVHSGERLNLRDIEQALENFKRLPTVETDIQIIPYDAPGAQPGESDLVIDWKQRFPFRLTLSADDSGSKATGKYQGGITLSYDNWWTLNDLFYISFNHDLGGDNPNRHGTRGYTIHYSVPFGYWLLGFAAGNNRYHQSVAGVNQTYLYSGESRNLEIKLSHLIYRDAARKTTLSLRGWRRSSKNFIDDTEVEVQRRLMAGWGFALSHQEFIGEGTLNLDLDYRRGTGAMGALPAPEEAFGEGTSRSEIIAATAQLNLPFTLGGLQLRYSGTLRTQWNRTPLVPQDRFSIAGRYTVRGFDGENTLSADRGWLIRNDLGWVLDPSGQELYLGIDYGKVAGPSSQALIGTRLSGVVLGLRGNYQGFSYDLFFGQPINKPDGFKTASRVAGFNFNWSF